MNTDQYRNHLLENRTKSEKRFAEMLTERGIFFKEQERVIEYYPDFYFPMHDHRIVELDGKFHYDRRDYDRARDQKLRRHGFKVLRVRSVDVFVQPDWLMHRVLMFLKEPHEAVSRVVRVRRRKVRKAKAKRCSPGWSKVPKLTKAHQTRKKDWKPIASIVERVEMHPPKPREVKIVKPI